MADFRYFRLHAHLLHDKGAKITRTKWWKLKGESATNLYEEHEFW
jgi:hypothetical protein